MESRPASVLSRLTRSKTLSLVAKLGLTVAAFWLVFHNMDVTSLTELMRRQDHERLAEVAALVYMQIALGAIRWRLILYALSNMKRHVISLLEILKLYYISVFFNCCLPGTVGGDVIRVWLAKSDQVPLSLSINSVIIDRMIALISLCLLVVAMLPLLGLVAGMDTVLVLPLMLLVVIGGIWFLLHLEKFLAPHEKVRPVRWLLYFISSLRLLLKHPVAALQTLLYSLIAHIGFCLYNYVLAQSLGIEISLLQCLALLPLVMLITTLPISIGGWGVREATMVGLLGLIGVGQAQALTLSIEVGLVNVITSLPAGILWLFYRRRSRHADSALTLKA